METFIMFKPKFLIRINYKSGIQEEFWVSKFEYDNTKITWECISVKETHPLVIAYDNVESIWIVKVKRIRWLGV